MASKWDKIIGSIKEMNPLADDEEELDEFFEKNGVGTAGAKRIKNPDGSVRYSPIKKDK